MNGSGIGAMDSAEGRLRFADRLVAEISPPRPFDQEEILRHT
jgi:hypothetical protein